jgi:hypothetical protein
MNVCRSAQKCASCFPLPLCLLAHSLMIKIHTKRALVFPTARATLSGYSGQLDPDLMPTLLFNWSNNATPATIDCISYSPHELQSQKRNLLKTREGFNFYSPQIHVFRASATAVFIWCRDQS